MENTILEANETMPRIVYGQGVVRTFVNPIEVSAVAERLNITRVGTADTAIYIGGKNNLTRRGLQIAGTVDRAIHGTQERNQHATWVVRVNEKVRGKMATVEDMNRTLVHELEHVAQAERDDPNVMYGNIAIWGLAAAGAVTGNIIAKRRGSIMATVAGTLIGGVVGHDIGYKIAPHERQARHRAQTVTTNAIQRV